MTAIERPPRQEPLDADAEAAVLSAILLAPAQVTEVRVQLPAEAFGIAAHRRIYLQLCAMHDSGEALEVLTLRSWLERAGELEAVGGVEALAKLLDVVPTAANLSAHVALVLESWKLRKLAAHARDTLLAVETRAGTADALRGALLHAMMGETYERPGRGFQRVGAAAADVLTVVEGRGRGELRGLRTGLREIDDRTGGLQAGELGVLAARPKVGKSTLVGQVAVSVALSGQGGAAFVSAEMPRRAIVERWLSALAGVPGHAMQVGRLSDVEWRRLMHAEERLRHAPLWIDDQALPELRDVEQRVLALKAQHPELVLVVVDYLQLVQHRLKGRRGDEEIEAVANALKRLADRAEVVLLAPAQLNDKAVEARPDKRPTRQDISGSSGPVKAADFVALLHRPMLDGTEHPGEGDRMHVYVDVARRTGPFTFTLDWQATVTRALDHGAWIPADAPLWLEAGPR